MSEHGCISDINSKNIQCEKILIKNGSQELLSTTTDNKLLLSTDIIPQGGVINLGSEESPLSGIFLGANTLTMVTDGSGPNLTIGASSGVGGSAPSLNIGTDNSNTAASLTVENLTFKSGTNTNGKSIFKPHTSLSQEHIFTLPVSTPSTDRFLKCDTNGNLTFDNIDYNNGQGTITSIFSSDVLVKNYAVGLNFSNDFNTIISTGYSDDRVDVSLNKNLILGDTEANTLFVNSTTFFDAPVNFNENNPIITLSGDVSGSATMNNLKDVTINTTIQNNSVALGTDTTGNYIATIVGTSNEINVSNSGSENANVTLSLPTTTSISSGKTLDVSSGTFTTSIAQQQNIVSSTNVTSAGAVMKSTIDVKGDILVGTANDTITRLPVGTNNFVLSADSSTATGLKWKAVSGGGGGGSSTFEGLADTESFSGNAGKILKLNTNENLLEFVDESSGGGGSTTFLNLNDVTPSSYSGQSGKSVIVNSSGNGLEFGLGNVDNTSDTNKPVSTAQQTALNLKAPIDNPTFTGDVSIGDDNIDSFVVSSNSLFTGTFKATGDGDIKEINDYMDLDFGLLTTSRPPQNKTGIYIPYYQYPDWNSGSVFLNGFNNLMNILDRNTDVPVLSIINPGSGPGTSYDANYGRFIKRLNNHNITIIGYLATTQGNKTVAAVKDELLRWFEFYPEIKGIFFDEVPEFTNSNKEQHIAYYNELYRMVKSESRRVLKRFLTVTINTGVTNEILYPLSIYEHSGDITNVCFDQILDHENSIYPNINSIETDNDLDSIRHFNRGARIAIVHSQNTYNETMVKKMMKYWSWLFITKDVMNNPFDDISLAYIEEMCKTFSDNSKFDDKLDKVGNITIGEDNRDLLTINSTINIPGGTTGQSLVKGADGNITYSTVSGGGGSDITIQNNSTELTTAATTLNFTTGITASGSGSTITIQKDSTILDGATITTNELNILDGNTSATSTTIVDADRVVLNDDGTMKQVTVTDLAAYFDDEITAMPNLTSVGTLSSLTVSGNLVADGSTFKLDSVNNRVGIGTSTPIRPLHIKSEGSVIAIEGNTHSYIEFYPDSYSSGRKGYFGYPGSTNDGLYFINENNANIVFGTSGSDRLTIDGSGNTGIGTTTPSTKLHVIGDITCSTLVGTSNSINLTQDTSTNSSLFIPFTDGTSGSRQLKGSSSLTFNPSTGTLSATNLSGSLSTLSMIDNRIITPDELGSNKVQFNFSTFDNNNSGAFADAIHFNTWSDSTGGNPNLLMLNKSNIGMRIYQGTFDSSSAYSTYKDVVLADSNGNIENSGNIKNSGNIGIGSFGTNNPISPLQIQIDSSKDATDSSNFDNYSIIMSKVGTNANNAETGLCFDIQGGTYPKVTRSPGAAITHERTGSWSQGKLHFKTKQTAIQDGDCVTAMTINEDGNVGIGIINPTYKLDVNGNAKINGDATINSDATINGDAKINGNSKINGDVVIGEDSNNYLVVNSETRFLNDVNIGGSSIKLHSSGNDDSSNFIEIKGEKIHSTHVNTLREIRDIVDGSNGGKVLKINSSGNGIETGESGGGGSGIVDNRIDGDLTIGEDTSEVLTIASKINIPRGETGQVLTKQTDGTTEFSYIDNYDGCVLLDSKTIVENTNNINLDATTDFDDYEYFEIVCINIIGTENGYIGWQPYNTSAITTNTDSKWNSTVITSNTDDINSNETKEWHILGFHTKGKQNIKAQIYNLNKSEKKYSFFNNVGLHSTTSNTISQNGSTSQNDTTACRYIRINNFSISDTSAAGGHISNAKILLYGFKPSGTIQTGTMIPTPTPSNSNKILQVNSGGSGLEYVTNTNSSQFHNYMSGMELIQTITKSPSNKAAAWEFTIPDINDYTHFKVVGLNIKCDSDGVFAWAGKRTNGNINTVHSEYSYIYTKIGSTDMGRGGDVNPGNGNGNHLIAEPTPGPINFEISIYGLHKTEQKYSIFTTTYQSSTSQYDNNTSYFLTGSTLQYGSSSSDDHICDKILFYNYDTSNNSDEFSGTIMLYGFKTNNTSANLTDLSLSNSLTTNNLTTTGNVNINGSFTFQNVTDFNNKGELIAATGNETFEILTNNLQQDYVLTVDTGENTGLKWKAQNSGSGGSTFESLNDTASFSGNNGKILKLNSSGNQVVYSNTFNDRLTFDGGVNLNNDTIIGEDSNDLLVVNSNSEFKNGLNVNGDIDLTGNLKQNGVNAVFSNWTVKNSDIYRNSKIGIGDFSSTNINSALEVDGDINLTGNLKQNGVNAVFSNWTVSNGNITRNSGVTINGESTLNSKINMGGHIIPTTDSTFDIGSSEYKVREINSDNIIANQSIISHKFIYKNITGYENLYYWEGENSFSLTTEPFVGNNSFSRITQHNLTASMYYSTNQWNNSYMFDMNPTIDARPSAFSTSFSYLKLSMPVKPGVSNSFFIKGITGDRWSSYTAFVNNENGTSNYYRLEPRTNTNDSDVNGTSSWLGPNAEPPIDDNGKHEWVQFYIPQYIIDDYCYTTTDDKSKYRKNINIYLIGGYGTKDNRLYISGFAMRENPIDLVICNGLVLHWYMSGGTSVTFHSDNWNHETLIQFNSGTQSNILIPIPNKKNPITNGYPSFILGNMTHENYNTYQINRRYVYLENNSNTSDTMNLGKFTRSNIGTFGLFVKERHKHPLGVIVPKLPYNSPYVVVVQHRPYIRIKLTTVYSTHYSRGFYTELLDYTNTHINMNTDGPEPVTYPS